MRKIMDGKRYDTETALEVCDHHNRLPRDDFNFLAETLYRTAKGNWFIYFEGGALTEHALWTGNSAEYNEGIKSLSEDEARSFVEAHGSCDDYERFFAVDEA